MNEERKPLSLWAKLGLAVMVTFFTVFFILMIFTVFPPQDFPGNTFIHVDRGKTVTMIGQELQKKGIIKSVTAFKVFMTVFGEKRMQVGTYFFRQPTSVVNVALKLTNRFFGIKPYRVTIPEGTSNAKVATILAKQIPKFDKKDFLEKTKNMEGKLFPDTYFFSPMDNVDDIIYEMNQNWEEQIAGLKTQIFLSGHTLNQVLTMASIIERETNKEEDRHLVSGILWKRLSLKMPLQVDVAKETYKEQGLPDQPIANPGLLAIEAAINPKDSPYLYYLTGRNGKMYYAKDFAEHRKNIRLYM